MAKGIRGTNDQTAVPPYSNGPYTWDQNLTLSGTNTYSGDGSFTGNQVFSKLQLTPTEYTVSGAITDEVSFVQLNSSGSAVEMTIAAPTEGRLLVITHSDVSTSSHQVTLTEGTFDGSSNVATFDAENETLVLLGLSSTRFAVLENIGSVDLA